MKTLVTVRIREVLNDIHDECDANKQEKLSIVLLNLLDAYNKIIRSDELWKEDT